jgi:hypothetical protein
MYVPEDDYFSQRTPSSPVDDCEVRRVKVAVAISFIVLIIMFRTFLVADAVIVTLCFGYLSVLWREAPSKRRAKRMLRRRPRESNVTS